MKRYRLFSLATVLLATVCSSNLQADYQCRQELMAGAWAENLDAHMLEREGTDIFPPPGPFSFVGIMEIDKTGKLIRDRHTNSTAGGPARPNLLSFFDVEITINPDCTGRRTLTVRHDLPSDHPFISVFGLERGQVVIEMDVVCTDGQRECWGTPTVPSYQVGNWRAKRIEPADGSVGARLDRIMRRLGLVP